MHAFLLFSFLPSALIGHHLFNESHGSVDGEEKELSFSSGIYVPLRHGRKPLVEVLEQEPVFHPMVWACLDVILQPLPRLRDGLQ